MSLVCVEDYEREALSRLPKQAADYYRSGATRQITLQENRTVFNSYKIRPRVLRDVSKLDLSVSLLGQRIELPFGIAPTALQKMAHPQGEVATARAAGSLKSLYIMSTISTSSIEEVCQAASTTARWFQLYIYKDRRVTQRLVRRAQEHGFTAIVLTVDAPFFGIRRDDVRNRFTLPPHLKMANFEGHMADNINKRQSGSGVNEYVKELFDSSVTWEDLNWLKSLTDLPIVVKGILRADEAQMAVKYGVAGIIVSNHGARQVDGTPTALEVLPEIVQAVRGSGVEVYMDGGIREGTDIFKALALGAKAVFIGRPAIWGLACDGQEGVERVLEILRLELQSTMAISGCTKISDITPDMVIQASKL